MKYLSKSEKETSEIARKIADQIKGGDLLALRGDLGSGKTTFTKYLAKALGITEEVASPTFVIMKKYDFSKDGEDFKLVHIDAYRFNQVEDAESIGLDEIINDKQNITVIEWPEKIWPVIENRSKLIDFEYVNESSRKISVK